MGHQRLLRHMHLLTFKLGADDAVRAACGREGDQAFAFQRAPRYLPLFCKQVRNLANKEEAIFVQRFELHPVAQGGRLDRQPEVCIACLHG